MANYSDQYYDEIDRMYDRLRTTAFAETLADPTPQDVYQMPLGPVGWVENADGDDGQAKVIINADGITILEGKIFLSDIGGNSVLSPAGFAGSWINFLRDGMYNSGFGYGTAGVDLAVTEVSGGDSIADYTASLSTELPYWIVKSAAGTRRLVTDADAPYGKALELSGTSFDIEVYQDVPITPGLIYNFSTFIEYINSASEFTFAWKWSWRDINHAIIGVETDDGISITTSSTGYEHKGYDGWETAPSNSVYLRFSHKITRVSGSPTVRLGLMRVYAGATEGEFEYIATVAGSRNLKFRKTDETNSRLAIGTGGIGMGSGSSSHDIGLFRNPLTWDGATEGSLEISGSPPILAVGHGGSGDASVLIGGTVSLSNDSTDGELYLRANRGQNAYAPKLFIQGSNSADPVFAMQHEDDTSPRIQLDFSGGISFGPGDSTQDVRFSRTSAGVGIFTIGTFGASTVLDAASIGSSQNNYNPSSGAWHKSFVLQVNPTASVSLTGLDAGVAGEMHLIRNNATGAFNLTLSYESASSTATNRFRYNGAASAVVAPNGAVWIWYSGARWQVIGI